MLTVAEFAAATEFIEMKHLKGTSGSFDRLACMHGWRNFEPAAANNVTHREFSSQCRSCHAMRADQPPVVEYAYLETTLVHVY